MQAAEALLSQGLQRPALHAGGWAVAYRWPG